EEMRLPLGDRMGRVAREPARVTQLRMNGRIRCVEADRDIARRIHRDAAHPAPGRIGWVGAFLEYGPRACRHIAQFEPADAGDTARVHGKVADHGFVIAEVAVAQTEHQTIADTVDRVAAGAAELRHAGTIA